MNSFHREKMLERIYNQIEAADFIGADMRRDETKMSFMKSDLHTLKVSRASC